jgi:group I intron endonuclease
MIGIYKITSPSRKVYIGQSKNLKKRFRYYKSFHCKNQIALYRSFLKYSVENHTFEIIEECTIELLNERERYWQENYNSVNNGLNCLLTSTKEKKKVYSKETIEKMSNSLKGRIITKEWRENLSKSGKGRVFSQETRNKIIKNNTGRKYSNETKLKIVLNRKKSKVIIDLETGVYYYSTIDLANILNINASSLYDYLTNRKKSINKKEKEFLKKYKLV